MISDINKKALLMKLNVDELMEELGFFLEIGESTGEINKQIIKDVLMMSKLSEITSSKRNKKTL